MAKPTGPVVRIYGPPKTATKKAWTFYVSWKRGQPAKATGRNLDRLMARLRAHLEEAVASLPEK